MADGLGPQDANCGLRLDLDILVPGLQVTGFLIRACVSDVCVWLYLVGDSGCPFDVRQKIVST